MTFLSIYLQGLILVTAFFTLVWLLSVFLKNASIVDIFWGLGFVLLNGFYFLATPGFSVLKIITAVLVTLWGLRLASHIFFRNLGKPEDYRYQEFRKNYGEKRYWWFSFFQVFLLQGTLVWLISAPLLAINYFSAEKTILPLAVFGIVVWVVGFTFEAGGDWQLKKFKSNPENKGKLLTSGFWKYTRHPNYFGDAAVWWCFAVLSIASGCYLPVLSSVLMTWLIVKVSGVSMLERTMKNTKPGFEDYVKKTSAFIPWFPKK
jgi:steroid 5-alpha reductase family enzyme